MGSLFVLCGTLMIMYGFICVVGENLQKDLGWGVLALFTFPAFIFYYAFSVNYAKGRIPMFVSVAGLLLIICGRLIGIE